MLAEAPPRSIARVEPVLIMLFNETGRIPHRPAPPSSERFGFRVPGLTELERYVWIVEFEGQALDERGFRQVAGLCGYRDDFDFHSASDVREIVSLLGSPRSIVNLVRWIHADAKEQGRRLIGSFDSDNAALGAALEKLGFVKYDRVCMEAGASSDS